MGNNTYSPYRDIKLILDIMNKYPSTISFYRMIKEDLKTDKLPPIVGRIQMGHVYLMFTSVEHLQDLYVNKN